MTIITGTKDKSFDSVTLRGQIYCNNTYISAAALSYIKDLESPLQAQIDLTKNNILELEAKVQPAIKDGDLIVSHIATLQENLDTKLVLSDIASKQEII